MLALWLMLAVTAEEPLRLWHSYRGAEQQVLETMAKAAPEPVIVTQVPFDTLQAKLLQALSVDNGPDVFIAPHERLRDWQRSLDEVAQADADIPVAREAFTVDGKLYAYPFSLKALALIRNKALAEDPVARIEDLPKPDGGNALGYESDDFYFHSAFYFGTTSELFDDRGALQTHAHPESFVWLRAHTKTGFITRGYNHTQLVARFRSGHISALVDGPWLLSDLGDGVKIAVQPIPNARPFASIEGLLIPKAKDTTPAHRLARYLASAEHCAVRITRARALPPYKACADAVPADDPLRGFYAAMDTALPMPVRKEMGFAWVPLKHLMTSVVSTDQPIEEAARDAERSYERLRVEEKPSPLGIDLLVYASIAGVIVWWWRKRKPKTPERSSSIAYALLAPGALFVVAFLLIPLAAGALLSLFSHEAGTFRYVGFGNFIALLSNPGFAFTLAVTVLWTVTNLACHLALGVSLALLLDRPGIRAKRLWRALLILPWAVPNYISALVFHNLFHFELGAVNQMLAFFHAPRVDWFGSFLTAFSANLITNAWLGFPFVMVMTLGALSGIDTSLQEAMRLDGASAWQRFRHLTIPQIAPVLAPAMMLSAMWTFNMFNVIYLVSGGEPRDETNILISEAYRWAFERGARYGYAAAYCVTIFLILWGFSRLRRAA